MKFSYTYDDLLTSLLEDLQNGLFKKDDPLEIERGGPSYNGYKPIIGYHYQRGKNSGEIEKKTVQEIIQEISHHNRITI